MPQPSKIPLAFASSGDKNVIPESTETTGLASWRDGFPAITSTPFSEGGIAPKRVDFNGIFNALSLATLWQQQGGFYEYDATTDYEVGNVVEYNNDLYKCLVANGPNSAVKAPTDTTVWSKVMTAADTAALYLPLAGGTMTGSIKTSANLALGRTSNSSQLSLVGGSDTAATSGAKCILYGANNTNSGWFNLQAGDSGGYKQLLGKPDGTLTWNGKDVATIETGTFTPMIKGETTTGSFTYTTQSGTYVKIGNLCYVAFSLGAKIVTVPTGYVVVTGLPYNGATANQTLVVNLGGGTWLNYPALTLRVGTSGACNIYGLNNSSSINALNPCVFTASATVDTVIAIRASGIYEVA